MNDDNTMPASAGSEDMPIGFKVNGAGHTLKHRPGALYEPLTLGEYLAAVKNPRTSPVDKDADNGSHIAAKATQTAFVPSAFRGHDARNGRAQEKNNGKYLALVLDIDGGSTDPLDAALAVFGNVRIINHNTYSDNQPGKGRRERLVIPLEPDSALNVLGYAAVIAALNERLMQAGCVVDPSSANKTQLAYFGMLGPWAEGHRVRINEGPLLDLRQCPDLVARAEQIRAVAPVADGDKYGSPRWTANLQLDSETILLHFGCAQASHDRLTFPGQTGQAGLQLFDDGGWSAWSETAERALGRKHGDALDLLRVYGGLTDNQITDIANATIYGYRVPPVKYWREHGAAIHKEATGSLQAMAEHGKQIVDSLILHDPKFKEFMPRTERAKLLLTTSAPLFEFSFTDGTERTAVMEHYIDPWMPKATVVGMYGRGETGKSTFVSTQCAEASQEVSTLWVSSEEEKANIEVRYTSSGGEVGTLAVIPAASKLVGTDTVAIFDAYEHLEKTIVDVQEACRQDRPLGIVVLDAIGALVTWKKGENANDDGSVKRLLAHLVSLSNRYQITIVIIGHLNKRAEQEKYAADAVTGSAAWTNSVRRAFMFIANHDAEQDFQYLVRTAKGNTGTPFAASYQTVPVHTLYKRADHEADEVLCRTDFTSPVVWGQKAVNSLIHDEEVSDEVKQKQSVAATRRQQRADAAYNAVAAVGSISRSDLKAYCEREYGLTLYGHHFKDLDLELQARGVTVTNAAHNKYVYGI